jgi:Mce-associated membrane protein
MSSRDEVSIAEDKAEDKDVRGITEEETPGAPGVTGSDDKDRADADRAEPALDDGRARPSRSLVRRVGELPRRASRRAGGLALRWRVTSMAVLGVLVAGTAVTSGFLVVKVRHDQATQSAENAAMAAAATDIGQILSYDYRHISTDLARANSDTTGEFSGQFGVLAGQLIGPAAAQQHTVTKATVPIASVISSSGNEVVVLAFVDQSTTNKSQAKPQQNVSQVQVTMEDVGGRWLVERFQAL